MQPEFLRKADGASRPYDPYEVYDTSRVDQINALFRCVYQWMAVGLILTAVAAYGVVSNVSLIRFFFSSQIPMAVVAVAEIGLVLWLGMGINRISAGTAGFLFVAYSVLNGIMCSVLLMVYTQESVYTTFFSTAGMFALMSVYGLYTKRDMTTMSGFFTMGLVGLLIAMLVNLFMRSSMMEFVISIIGVILFLGLTAYDTQKIRRMGCELEDGEDGTAIRKAAIIGALELYLDFINIFIYLLRLFGRRR